MSTISRPASGDKYRRKVAARIRILRHARGWSAQKLADALAEFGHALDRRMIFKIETEDRGINVDELVAFAEVFRITVLDLLDDGPVCRVCSDAPPAGFSCLNCGVLSERAAPPVPPEAT